MKDPRQHYIPNFKHLSQVVLQKKIFKYFYVFLWYEPRTPLAQAILDHGTFIYTNLVKDSQVMLHTKFQVSEPSGSEEENFLIYFYGSNLGPLV